MPAATPSEEALARLWRAGVDALRGGRPLEAFDAFSTLRTSRPGDPAVLTAAAEAARVCGRIDAQAEALEALLRVAPADVRGLMMMGDLHAGPRADPVAAAAYYRAVVRIAQGAADLPPDLRAAADRAAREVAASTAAFEAFLRARLEGEGLSEPGAERVRASLEILVGRREIYLQQPTQHYFPGLPQVAVYPRSQTPWLAGVEADWTAIREEFLALAPNAAAFAPYVTREPDRPFFDASGLADDPSWSAAFLWKDGRPNEAVARLCPRTMAAVERAPLCRIPGRAPSVLFSLLRPGTHIPPHHGLLNSRLICHLPLVIPEACALRVGAETIAWREGEAFAFDDSVEHEAWNRSDRLRAVLIFDVWRPELTPLERRLVAAMVTAGADYGAFGGEGSL